MLTDEELTTRLSAAFHESLPDLTYAGPVPQVRRHGTRLAATSALAVAATLVLVPAALQQNDGRVPDAVPSDGPTSGSASPSGHRVVRTLDMTESEVRAWAEAANDAAVREGRTAAFARAGYGEVILRSPDDMPPNQPAFGWY